MHVFPIYVVGPLVAWCVAQGTKFLFQKRAAGEKRQLSYFYKSGNMPSAHSALMLSLLTIIGARQGVDSPMFGIVFVLAAIILYDALNVRRSVGEHGVVLRKLLSAMGREDEFFNSVGHTITEVVVGGVIGILVAIILLQFI